MDDKHISLTEQSRLAQHYLEKLRFIQAVYSQGGGHILYALRLLNQEWAQIKQWHAWAARHWSQSDTIAVLCSGYASTTPHLLDLILTMQEHLDWQIAALQAAQQVGNQRSEIAHLLALARIYEKLDCYAQAQDYTNRALLLGHLHHDDHSIAQGAYLMGVLSNNISQYTEASASFKQSLRLCTKLQDDHGIALNLTGLGSMMLLRGHYKSAQMYFQESLHLYQRLGDQQSIAETSRALALVLNFQGDYENSALYYDSAMQISRQIRDEWGAAKVMSDAAMRTLGQLHIAEARTFCEESLKYYSQIGSRRGMAQSLLNLGLVECLEENYEVGCQHCRESVVLYREIGNRYGIADSLISLAYGYQRMRNIAAACEVLLEALQLTLEIGAYRFMPMIMAASSYHYLLTGRAEQGAVMYGLADSSPYLPAYVKEFAFPILLGWLRESLDSMPLTAAIEHGRSMNLMQIVGDLATELSGAHNHHALH